MSDYDGEMIVTCRCQSYEGGIGGEPGNEAHGGYTFCGLAALCLLGKAEELDIPALLRWAVRMQGKMEGGFMGRTHKLVDGCYSYWQGAVFSLLGRIPESSLYTDTPILDIAVLPGDVPRYDKESECTTRTAAKEQAQKNLMAKAEELELDYESALAALLDDSLDTGTLTDRIQHELFRSAFVQAKVMVDATEYSFSAMFPLDSEQRAGLPLYRTEDTQPEADCLYDAVGLQFWVL